MRDIPENNTSTTIIFVFSQLSLVCVFFLSKLSSLCKNLCTSSMRTNNDGKFVSLKTPDSPGKNLHMKMISPSLFRARLMHPKRRQRHHRSRPPNLKTSGFPKGGINFTTSSHSSSPAHTMQQQRDERDL